MACFLACLVFLCLGTDGRGVFVPSSALWFSVFLWFDVCSFLFFCVCGYRPLVACWCLGCGAWWGCGGFVSGFRGGRLPLIGALVLFGGVCRSVGGGLVWVGFCWVCSGVVRLVRGTFGGCSVGILWLWFGLCFSLCCGGAGCFLLCLFSFGVVFLVSCCIFLGLAFAVCYWGWCCGFVCVAVCFCWNWCAFNGAAVSGFAFGFF